MKNPKLGASLLSVPNFLLPKKIKELYQAKIDYFHIDIMDGNFVPNLSISPVQYEEIYKYIPTALYDLHFMVTEKALEKLLPAFLHFPPQFVTVHQEAISNWQKVAQQVRNVGAKFGIALNPDTSVDSMKQSLKELDLILLMSVVPGYGGQKFMEATYEKLQILNNIREKNKLSFLIQIDGGINLTISKQLVSLGADLIVIGSDLIQSKDPVSYIKQFAKQ
jgi:ribulose-phosphate 3-epimerase